MTTLVIKLDPKLARAVARAADTLTMTHDQVGLEAVRLFVRSIAGYQEPDAQRRRPRASTTRP